MMGEVASGIKAFQKGMRDDDDKPVNRVTTTADIEAREAEKTREL
jgi:sec-independent protein translocase protein TatA